MNYFKKIISKINFYIVLIICMGIIFYTLTLRGVSGNPEGKDIKNNLDQNTKPLELSPERGRFILTKSLADNYSLSLTKELADASYPDAGYSQGKYYILFAPGVSLFALPLYKLGSLINMSLVGAFATIPLFAIGSLIFLYKISTNILKLPSAAGLLSSFIFGFGSTSWSYATTMYQHHLTTFFILSSIYAVWKYKNNQKTALFWGAYVWLAFAISILIDYPNAMFMLPIMIYFALSSISAKSLKNKFILKFNPIIIFTSVIFIIITAFHLYSNYIHYGGWLRLSNSIVSTKTIQEKNVFKEKNNNTKFEEIEKAKTATSFFRETNLPKGLAILIGAPDKGILFFSPIFVLSIFGIWKILKKLTIEIGVLLSIVISNFLLYASFGDPWGGWAFGPRYLIPAMSILSLFIPIWVIEKKINKFKKIVTYILLAISSAIALVGAVTTNAIPPRVEAVALGAKYNFLRNIDFLVENKSSSFIYNSIFTENIHLIFYYSGIFAILLIVIFYALYILPINKK